ncbi:hypothetical protein [Hydrogenophaga sp.]|uniref:hypothetical protein n=1 Tax=Hydrogenophaga sp. TaxID=1904254 RepID=UPI002726D1FE|nr:hypothetical protein [Hydrogenophaga sp.]MDO8903247.1 hypothetical protein [Hydrogenophaga sp.]
MKLWKLSSVVFSCVALTACGGGGDEPGDVGEMAVDPAAVTWTISSCDRATSNALSVHTINGGKPPFRLLNSFPQNFEFGTIQVVNGAQRYVPLPLSSTGVAELRGKDPQFAVLTSAGCSDISFIVLDQDSQRVNVEITVEEDSGN